MMAEEALKEAQRRWGEHAAICNDEAADAVIRMVGVLTGGEFVIKGRGASWEDAFHDAEVNPREEPIDLF
jgi:hypothetical protein